VLLFDEQSTPGGSLLATPGGGARARALTAAAERAGVRVQPAATAIAFFPEDDGVLAVVTPAGLRRIAARRFLYATGAYDQNLAFADNDRPGVLSARACGRLAFQYGVRPVPLGQRVVVVAATMATGAAELAAALGAAGVEVELVEVAGDLDGAVATDDRGGRGGAWVVGARGSQAVRGLEIAGGPPEGATRVVPADLVAVAALPAPASELPRQHGAAAPLDPARGGFAVLVDTGFRTRAAQVYACGDVTGFAGWQAAGRAGESAGRAIAADAAAEARP
jgi:sarcosine oxidase subunit alpha